MDIRAACDVVDCIKRLKMGKVGGGGCRGPTEVQIMHDLLWRAAGPVWVQGGSRVPCKILVF